MSNQNGKVLLFALVLIFVVIAGFFILFKQEDKRSYSNSEMASSSPGSLLKEVSDNKEYLSNDLSISFTYPLNWTIDDRYHEILIASFNTSLNENKAPFLNEIAIIIHNARGCHKTIEENLVDPSCGELGEKARNEIVFKEVEEFNGAKFYKYVIKAPGGEQQKVYFLGKSDRVLQIDKSPEVSRYDDEFIKIVKSIKFVNQ